MRLSEFLRSEMEAILVEWETFARSLTTAVAPMNSFALRDHAQKILEAIALDIETPQTLEAQDEKSKGHALVARNAAETAAQTHATLRGRSGFDINQLAAEYRALRASVLRLWTAKCEPRPIHPGDVMRFNEAIDQALAESISFFATQADRNRNLLLGMLGHDMRTPLNSVLLTAQYLRGLKVDDEISDAAAVIVRGGAAITALLDDLLDYNRATLGVGISVKRADVDLAPIFATEVELQRHANPDCRIELHMEGATRGRWDGARLQQVLRNLLSNALQHGSADAPVEVTLRGREQVIEFEVKNYGATIDTTSLDVIFDPLQRGPAKGAVECDSIHLGIGLYIVREVVRTHGGDVEVRSADGETVFAVRLPRHTVTV